MDSSPTTSFGRATLPKMLPSTKLGPNLAEFTPFSDGTSSTPRTITLITTMKAKKSPSKIMVDAPEGYHWMNQGGRFYLMKHDGEFKPHKGASLKMPFKVITSHQ